MASYEMEELIDLRPEEGVSRINKRVFSDPQLFDLEMKTFFEGNWVFVGLESQLPKKHDFLTTTIGRHPILIMRNSAEEIQAFYNSCPHRGARICTLGSGNSPLHVCPYHAWSFTSAGKNRAIKGKSEGQYSNEFLSQKHDLHQVAKFASYRGLMFASLTSDVQSLEEYLGDARAALDLVLDQSEDGLEFVPGSIRYTFRANWKQQLENCVDPYHVTSTHPTYFHIAKQREEEQAVGDEIASTWDRFKSVTEEHASGSKMGSFGFENGHAMIWGAAPPDPGHALYDAREDLERRCGEIRKNWMFYSRNLTIFPNVQFAQNFSSQLRIIRPISPELTEMQTFCLAPIGESRKARALRLRQFEDFFNPTGMATPDDNIIYEECQEGHQIEDNEASWMQGHERGLTALTAGAGDAGAEIGIDAAHSVEGNSQLSDETVFHAYYRNWAAKMAPAIAAHNGSNSVELAK